MLFENIFKLNSFSLMIHHIIKKCFYLVTYALAISEAKHPFYFTKINYLLQSLAKKLYFQKNLQKKIKRNMNNSYIRNIKGF